MKKNTLPAVALLLWLGAPGCEWLLNFSTDGLPCGPGGTCDATHFCNAQNVCVGGAKTCPACPPGFGCNKMTGACDQPVCDDQRLCGQAQSCDPGSGSCQPIASGQPGGPCASSSDCSAGALCISPLAGPGFCALPCSTGDSQCPTGTRCAIHAAAQTGATIRLCLGNSFGFCTSESDCAPWGLHCALFEQPQPGGEPLVFSACAQPVGPGAALSACDFSKHGADCATGMCLGYPDGRAFCTPLCSAARAASDCGASPGATCQQVPTPGMGRVNACVKEAQASQCNACTSSAQCGPDAPQCVAGHCSYGCGSSADCPAGVACSAVASQPGQYCICQ